MIEGCITTTSPYIALKVHRQGLGCTWRIPSVLDIIGVFPFFSGYDIQCAHAKLPIFTYQLFANGCAYVSLKSRVSMVSNVF